MSIFTRLSELKLQRFEIVAAISALPWCCILLPFLSITAMGTAMSLDHEIAKIILPFVSWPLLLYAHYRLWKGLWLSKRRSIALNWNKVGLNICLILVSTSLVLYFSYIHLTWTGIEPHSHHQLQIGAFCFDILGQKYKI